MPFAGETSSFHFLLLLLLFIVDEIVACLKVSIRFTNVYFETAIRFNVGAEVLTAF
jgi:hypothetical protein